MSISSLRMTTAGAAARVAQVFKPRGADRRKMRGIPVEQQAEGAVTRAVFRATLREGRAWLPINVCDFMYHAGLSLSDAQDMVKSYETRPYRLAA